MNQKSTCLILFILLFGLAIISLSLAIPPDTHAHPAYGFTPQPPPPPGGGGGDDDDDDGGGTGGQPEPGSEGGSDDTPPPDYIIVQLERCDLICAADYPVAEVGQPVEQVAADGTGDQTFAPPLPIDSEVLAHVRLVHQGSGWITEAILSDAKSTRIAVPYPGRWEIFLIEEPEFSRPEAVDPTRLGLIQIKVQLESGPISLGEVEANVAEPQYVLCPVPCVIDLPPPTLPETGANTTPPVLLFISTAFVGLLLYLTYRTYRKPIRRSRN